MKSIVVADPSEETAKVLKAKFKSRKYKISWAKDGEEAVALLEAESPDLLVMDLLLPKIHGHALLIWLAREVLEEILIRRGRPCDTDKCQQDDRHESRWLKHLSP